MNTKTPTLVSIFLRMLFYALILFIVSKVIEYDMYKQSFKEDSLTERFQEIIILSVAIISGFIAYKFPKIRVFAILLGSFSLISFIRELDAFLENNLFDKAWQLLASIVLLPTIYYVAKKRKLLVEQFGLVSNSLPFGVLMIGVLILHLFSRLYGRKVIWKAAMGEDKFMRVVKDASEEGIELLAYSIMLIGIIEFYRFAKQKLEN